MDIVISNSSGKPIYEQITAQIKGMILNGKLKSGDALPSIRFLARELKISVITTKRAYTDLERDGFIETVSGKGSYVAKKNVAIMREQYLKLVEDHIQKAVECAKSGGITYDETAEMLSILFRK